MPGGRQLTGIYHFLTCGISSFKQIDLPDGKFIPSVGTVAYYCFLHLTIFMLQAHSHEVFGQQLTYTNILEHEIHQWPVRYHQHQKCKRR
jgi:hypothetical protein